MNFFRPEKPNVSEICEAIWRKTLPRLQTFCVPESINESIKKWYFWCLRTTFWNNSLNRLFTGMSIWRIVWIFCCPLIDKKSIFFNQLKVFFKVHVFFFGGGNRYHLELVKGVKSPLKALSARKSSLGTHTSSPRRVAWPSAEPRLWPKFQSSIDLRVGAHARQAFSMDKLCF